MLRRQAKTVMLEGGGGGAPELSLEGQTRWYRTGTSGHWGRLRQKTGLLVPFGVRRQGYSTYEMRVDGPPIWGMSDYLNGRDISRLSSSKLAAIRNKKIGFVFQQFNLLPRTTALENVELPMVYTGLWRRERKRRAREALALVGLSDREHHQPSQLSGGQQQRVAIARALVNKPLLLLADEPTGALDSRTSDEIMSALVHLNEGGLTVVVVTHEPDVARYARRVVHFKDGNVISDEINQDVRVAA